MFVLWSEISQVLVGGIYLESEFTHKPSFVQPREVPRTLWIEMPGRCLLHRVHGVTRSWFRESHLLGYLTSGLQV